MRTRKTIYSWAQALALAITASLGTSLLAATPTITSAGTANRIPIGAFSATITGTNFLSTSKVSLCGMTVPTTYVSPTSLKISGFCPTVGNFPLTVVAGTVTSPAFTVAVGIINPKTTAAAARRFLEQAAFGPSPSDALAVQNLGMSAWIDAQFALPQSSTYAAVTPNYNGMPEQFMTDAVTKPDQLRQRVAFALSQIFVTSLVSLVDNANMIPYQDKLLADAFTNYKTIVTDVTMSNAMGQYLNLANNAKADPTTNSLANENYARELMQLFTLGTSQLNADGSVKFDSNSIPLPTYSQFQVTEFARVFTGWTYPPPAGKAVFWPGDLGGNGTVMVAYPSEHDTGSKQLLNGYVAPANATPAADMSNAIANIFAHPNVGPFVSRMLIQHLVKSNPTPAYISRMTAVFNNNGSNVRGDMKALVKAILLDPEARANDQNTAQVATDGHLQEPALFIAGMYRAFGGSIGDSNLYGYYLGTIGQGVFSSPDVFNYYAPNYAVPGTNLIGGEFEINNPSTSVLRANLVTGLFGAQSNVQNAGPGTSVDLTPYIYLGSNPTLLVNALDLTLTHGKMPADMKEAIVAAVNGETSGNLRRVQRGIYLILTSSYYNVWH